MLILCKWRVPINYLRQYPLSYLWTNILDCAVILVNNYFLNFAAPWITFTLRSPWNEINFMWKVGRQFDMVLEYGWVFIEFRKPLRFLISIEIDPTIPRLSTCKIQSGVPILYNFVKIGYFSIVVCNLLHYI